MTQMASTFEPYSYRQDPAVPAFADDRPIIIFDGKCVLCSGFVQFILRHDRNGQFRFIAAQSALGTALYRHYGLDPVAYETNILLEAGRIWVKSTGSMRMFQALGLPWSLASAGRLLPRSARDRLYDIVAGHRLQWFGVRDSCLLPEAKFADRFLG
jgi:predicted DCC family thiol-disulfide oxidoreductase YuxK